MSKRHFLCYSRRDAEEFGLKLYNALLGGPPPIPVWMDRHDIRPGEDWDDQIVEALRACESLLLVITDDSVSHESVCKDEWTHALKYKKPIVPLLLHADVELPFRLGNRQYIDFTGEFETGLAKLREHLLWLASSAGMLQAMRDRLADAQRDLQYEQEPRQRVRIEDDIVELEKQIGAGQRVVDDPEGVAREVQQRIDSGLERERKPQRPPAGEQRTRFINPPPGVAPEYFQNRFVETKRLGALLQDDATRLITVIARAGMGKTALVCRLLKALENGRLPDDEGPMRVEGIVYLSETGSRRVNFAHLYEDLCKLLPEEDASRLREMYKVGQLSVDAKMRALLAAFPTGHVVLLLDNFEDVVDGETRNIKDVELDEALRALLNAPQHPVTVMITTRVAPRDLALVQPGRQARIEVNEGLESPYAENLLRDMDPDDKLGLKSAPDELLQRARQRTMGNPRALEHLFAILAADRNTSLEEILAVTQRLPENVTEVLVGEAFNRLDPAGQMAMQALAIYVHPVTPAAVDYLLQPFLPGVDSAAVLGRLVNMHFARKETGKYYLHPVDRAYALSRIPEGNAEDREHFGTKVLNPGGNASTEEKSWLVLGFAPPPFTRYALRHRGADYFHQTCKPRAEWKSLDDFAPQLAEFDLRCAGEDYETAAWVLRQISFDHLLLWGHARLLVELHEQIVAKIRDKNLLAGRLLLLGLAYIDLGQYEKAISHNNEALAIWRDFKDGWGEGACVGNLGLCYAALGQTARAIERHEQALTIHREIGNRRGEGNQLGNLGNCYTALGQTALAIENYEQALAISREIADRRGEGADLGNLGLCYAALGQTAQATEYLEQALVISREIGYRRGEGADLGNLGNCYGDLGQTARAIKYLDQALAIQREIGDRRGEGNQLGNLADVLIQETRYEEAVEFAESSIQIAGDIGDPVIACEHNRSLALARFYLGELTAARKEAERAREFDVPMHIHHASALLAVIALRQKDVPAAQAAFADAVRQADALLDACAENYKALDTKGLSLCGLVLCETADSPHSSLLPAEEGIGSLPAGDEAVAAAVVCFRRAREINVDAGYLLMHLRLFDAMAECDLDGRVRPAREAACGK